MEPEYHTFIRLFFFKPLLQHDGVLYVQYNGITKHVTAVSVSLLVRDLAEQAGPFVFMHYGARLRLFH